MLHQLANLPDNELMARARKLKDEEAAGILLERYSHLLAVVSLPSLNNYDNTPDEFFPSLLKRLFKSLQTQTIPKIGEWMQFFIKSQGNREARNTYYFPTSASSDITRLENKVEKANNNLMQRKELTVTMKTAFDDLETSHKEILKEFYFDQKTFAEIAADREYTMDKIRKMIKRSKQELASLILEKLEYAKINKYTSPTEEEQAPILVIENEVPKKKKKGPASSVKSAAPRKQKQSNESAEPALVLISAKSAIIAREQPTAKLIAVEEGTATATMMVAVEAAAMIVAEEKEATAPTMMVAVQPVEAIQPIKQGPALVLVSTNATTQTASPASVQETGISTNQEKDLNQGYATSRKQGQDIQDLQQGSLF
ncbi:sigma-70 RNA polymerase sigma factor region 4 domain-containing protein [Chitinophaga sancti]|uniref:Sigma-70 family RNA polymerase sigma factor n=1 Tax=Chitinophaga sancti TaxID=1004 RepID=A0A1K1RBA8_9BACT|nr:sigma-70 family RNA polymerase sigma factor [Chitinophaga sancti]WQD65543.1 sigma-70 family RNA polymerase sigma factor [Chitinophaga sancti]WQG88834.1 sigma-70 family RNA polymerase sigma factor [Chitinophaga sancti]SFW69083.1 hypothetical protein SAMN05661012_03548 [Chitinophaga sancti]